MSSANCELLVFNVLPGGISFTYSLNNKGPNTLPCGTPAIGVNGFECTPLIDTCPLRLVRNPDIHFIIDLCIPYANILNFMPSSHSLSNAFSTSNITARVHLPYLNPFSTQLLSLYKCSSVLRPVVKPD